LKPENTFLRSDGVVKVLDFGLAKLQQSLEGVPTAGDRTLTGVILGTAGYMAPEQVRGEDVDARADLFALGVMLYEMLAGQHPFRRGSTFETLHAVLTVDPPHVTSLNARVPATLERIVMRLIQRTPEARFQSALDALWALEQVATEHAYAPASLSRASGVGRPWRSRQTFPVASPVFGVLALAAVWSLFAAAPDVLPRPELTRFTWPLPPGLSLGSAPIVSPDGRRVAFVGVEEQTEPSRRRLYVRDRASREPVLLPGTDGAMHPLWSPDGTTLAFFAGGHLRKVAWQGGAPVTVTSQTPFPFGGTWGPSGTFVFAPDVIMSGLRRVAAAGDQLEQATLLDTSLGETAHAWPTFLPDGVHFLYFVRSTLDERRGVYLARIDTPAARPESLVLRSDSNAVYVPFPGTNEGALLYVVDGRVEARRFDPDTRRFAGDARTLADVSAIRRPARFTS
jgi:hypothetical protein